MPERVASALVSRRMQGPNFFVAGAAKSATTALYHALREHDAVYLPSLKEPHAYLADPSTAGHLYPGRTTARQRYRALYAGVTHETAVGDASTTNLVVHGTAAVIASDSPAARIVVNQYLGWGRYHAQLPQFFEHFGRERALEHSTTSSARTRPPSFARRLTSSKSSATKRARSPRSGATTRCRYRGSPGCSAPSMAAEGPDGRYAVSFRGAHGVQRATSDSHARSR